MGPKSATKTEPIRGRVPQLANTKKFQKLLAVANNS